MKRYREYESFPGFEIDAIGAQRFVKSVLEWNAPPFRFEEIGHPGFYLSYIRPAVFVGTLVDRRQPGRRTAPLPRPWLQLDLNFTVLDHLPMTVSFGYAQGFEESEKVDDEWLLSLKVL